MKIAFDNSLIRVSFGQFLPASADPAPAPELLLFNADLAAELGLDRGDCDDAALAAIFGGNRVPDGAEPVALAYAGHQFGHFSPQLGDGRALLLGEFLAPDGRRFDLQLKGSGRTPFSRGGDGKAGIGPVLREYLVSEAMAALGVPTTRALAAVTTGEQIWRDQAAQPGASPGAVLARVAASHLRVGTVQFLAAHGEPDHVRALVDHALARHYPGAADSADPALALLDAVCGAQAQLVARWMGIGFVHGVMNSDNITLSGETIDYGPCAFLDSYAAGAKFSAIDRAGRYAFGNQPRIMAWNMARLAEALLPAMVGGPEAGLAAASAVVDGFAARYQAALGDVMAPKLGLSPATAGLDRMIGDLFAAIDGQGVDFTMMFRDLACAAGGDFAALARHSMVAPALKRWQEEWQAALTAAGGPSDARRTAALAASPAVIPRNHLVEAALNGAAAGRGLDAFHALLAAVRDPFAERAADDRFVQPPPTDQPPLTTFCGT